MKVLFTTLLLCGLSLAHAEPADPLDANAPAPAPRLETGLDHYQPFDETTTDWRAANDTVRQIGGWRTYLREADGGASDPRPHPHH